MPVASGTDDRIDVAGEIFRHIVGTRRKNKEGRTKKIEERFKTED
jgi:hypothetical protein